ncbi:hypothetical protein RHSIM_RhsimUnG0002500 [Rhododendron simsii]|uniref:Uncharacterized protein n=1 Tax=Rhododendron simsii TaxID=118357 RepID=A0A834FY03_RHOSS|nr:hypothetical protein RHSIM_RhsimUnG0002500 [Rhododendron simsii]
MAPPLENWLYRPNAWNRPLGVTEDWDDFLALVGEEDISWHCPWLRLPTMTTSNMGSQQVCLAGLTGFTFYMPFHILHQLGISQCMPPPGSEVLCLPLFTISGLRNYV